MGLFSKDKRSSGVSAQNVRPTVPKIPASYYEEILNSAGYPNSPNNLAMVVNQIGTMFLVKAQEFISTQGQAAAKQFVEAHGVERYFGGDLSSKPVWGYPEWVLTELGNWNEQVIPYIQDLPERCCSIMLQTVGKVPFWGELES